MIFSFFLLKDVILAPARKYTNFYPASCLSNEKHSKVDKTTDYLANYPSIVRGGGLSESVKKRTMTKIFFTDNIQ